jgi:hypothetical protein
MISLKLEVIPWLAHGYVYSRSDEAWNSEKDISLNLSLVSIGNLKWNSF